MDVVYLSSQQPISAVTIDEDKHDLVQTTSQIAVSSAKLSKAIVGGIYYHVLMLKLTQYMHAT
jgi:hypothetical protein